MKTVERSILCTPGSLPRMQVMICKVEKIRFFKGRVATKGKFHLTLGHDTVMCTATFFGSDEHDAFTFDHTYKYQDELGIPNESESATGGDDLELQACCQHQFALLEMHSFVSCWCSSKCQLGWMALWPFFQADTNCLE
eukprot:m.120119 g.120119  ORF g.120119 m.120119 type:complete len:139 (-) comp14347_c0_seq2:1544-1960(-)